MARALQKTKKSKASKSLPKLRARRAGRPAGPTQKLSENEARLKLIETGAVLFGENGLEGVSTREIAKKSGLNISLISYYFGGKVGLYKEVLRSHLSASAQQVQEIVARNRGTSMTFESFCDDMGTLIDYFMKVGKNQRSMITIMERERLQGMPYAKAIQEEMFGSISEKLHGLIIEAQERGFVRRNLNPSTFFILFFESLFGYMRMAGCDLSFKRKAHQFPAQAEQLKEVILDIFLKGICR